MKKYLLIYAVIVTALLAVGYRRYHAEIRRLTQNQQALSDEVVHYRTHAEEEAASGQVLRLRLNEFQRLRADDAARIRQLGIRLRRVEAAARHATSSTIHAVAPLRDTIIVRERGLHPAADTVQSFRWQDAWTTIEGTLQRDSVRCTVRTTDTLRQVVHRIPRRFLFIRWGTKALRQEIVSSNPHTRIVCSEYVKIER